MNELSEQAYGEALAGAALFRLSRYALSEISGPDAARYTQGRITQDVASLAVNQGAHFMVLSPQGRVLSLGLIYKTTEGFLTISEAQTETTFRKAFLQFCVADQVEFKDLEDQQLALVLGPHSEQALASLGECEVISGLTQISFAGSSIRVLPAAISPVPGIYCIGSSAALDQLAQRLSSEYSINSYDDPHFEVARISLKIPSQKELSDKCIATDFPFEEYISFKKGCYSGQEVVEMSTARGRPNRRLLALSYPTESAPVEGIEVTETGKKVGFVSSSCYLPLLREARVLAFLKTTVADDASLEVNGAPATLLP